MYFMQCLCQHFMSFLLVICLFVVTFDNKSVVSCVKLMNMNSCVFDLIIYDALCLFVLTVMLIDVLMCMIISVLISKEIMTYHVLL